MKAHYLLAPLIASIRTMASPLMDGANALANSGEHLGNPRAPDPPPAPTPLPPSTDGVLPNGSVINYTPNNPSNREHSCWTPPKSRPPPSTKYQNGTCSVCVLQRNGTDRSADYQLWARDNENNAMGNMGATTIFPMDNQQRISNKVIIPTMPMGPQPLIIMVTLSTTNPYASQVNLGWAVPPKHLDNAGRHPITQQAMFDTAVSNFGNHCVLAGMATNGEVVYVQCFFDC